MTSAIPYCADCDHIPCECDTYEVHPQFLKRQVDQESLNGFNPAYWARAMSNNRPIRIDQISKAFWRYDSGVWRESRTVVADRLPTMMARTFRHGRVADVSTYLAALLKRDRLFIVPDQPDSRYISVPAGLFDLVEGDVVPHDPRVLTTYQIQVDPDFDCPTTEFDKFLTSVLHPGDMDRVLDILAYLLLPGNPEQKAVLLCGKGRNGKGVLLRVIEAIIGSEFMAGVSLQELGTRFAAADLYGKVINIVGDIDGDHISHTGKFKQMTGGDTVRMDVKGAQAFSGRIWAVPVFSANQIPTSADTSHGYLRRWEVIDFPNTFDGSDRDLVGRLLSELPAIVGKLLAHAMSKPDPFSIRKSEPGLRAHNVFANRSDPVRTWLAETTLEGFTERKDAYLDYRMWIEDGNGKSALTRNNFFDRVVSVLGDPKTVRGARGWELKGLTEERVAP